jgi:hypothetical protein
MAEMKEKFDILRKSEVAYSNFMEIKDNYQEAEEIYSSLTNKLVDLGSEVGDLHLTKKTQILKLAQELSMFGNHEKLPYPLPTSVSHTPNKTPSQAVWMIIMLMAVILLFILPFSFDLFDSETHSMQNNTGLNKGYREF